jgi:hypothetical protein
MNWESDMSHMRTHLSVEPSWQGPGSTGCWDIGYYLDEQRDKGLILTQGLDPGADWFIDVYSSTHRQRLPEETVSLARHLSTVNNSLLTTCTILNARGSPVEYYIVADERVEELVNAARVWHANK